MCITYIYSTGKDFTIGSSDGSTKLWFEPGIHRVVLPISIIEDSIPEIQEKFELVISGLSNHPQVIIPLNEDHTEVYIVDNDGNFWGHHA